MKKRAISSLLAVLFAVGVILPALATESADDEAVSDEAAGQADMEPIEEPVEEPESFVLLNGIPQLVEYEIRDGTTYVTVSSFAAMADPQAEITEEDGVVAVSSARVEQVVDDEGNAADVVQETLSMTASVRDPYIVANGRYVYVKGGLTTVNGQAAAPIRKLAEVFNLDVFYDAAANKALLTHVEGRSAYIQSGDSYYDEDALYWLSHIINAESGNQSLEGKIAVGNVVMNRVNSDEFPNTIYDVLHQKNQFSPVSSGSIKRNPNDGSIVAAKLVMEGVEVVPTALFFNMKGMNTYASRNRNYVTTIGAHAFYA